MENQEPNEDRSQDDLHREVGPSVCQSRHSVDSGPGPCLQLICVIFKIKQGKLPKVIKIRIACIVYFVTFPNAIFFPFEVLVIAKILTI